jgi:hypothetical protein
MGKKKSGSKKTAFVGKARVERVGGYDPQKSAAHPEAEKSGVHPAAEKSAHE